MPILIINYPHSFKFQKIEYLITEILLIILWSGMLDYGSRLDRNQKCFHVLAYNPIFLISNSWYVKYTVKIRILTNDPPPFLQTDWSL